jgi:prevent-host-death family protein
MKKVISKSKFKPHALEYFREVEKTGKELIITDRGKPVVKITPYVKDQEAPLRSLKGSVSKYKDPTQPISVEDWGALK